MSVKIEFKDVVYLNLKYSGKRGISSSSHGYKLCWLPISLESTYATLSKIQSFLQSNFKI